MARVLVTNDDGIGAPGLRALVSGLEEAGHAVFVCAPERERSAAGHALTMHKPLRAKPAREGWWAVSGSPVDCVYLAVHHLLGEAPDIVVSGVNRGSNLGCDVLYSGTVAAALEACIHGVAGVAVSTRADAGGADIHWGSAVAVARRVVAVVLARGLPAGVALNVNVPDRPEPEILGLRTAALGVRTYAKRVTVRRDPRGKPYYWIGGEHVRFEPIEGTDGPLLAAGWATVTPIAVDLTRHDALASLREWTDA